MPEENCSRTTNPHRTAPHTKTYLVFQMLKGFYAKVHTRRGFVPAGAALGEPKFMTQPIGFERNDGQTASEVRYFSRGPSATLFLTERRAVLSLHGASLEMTLKGASPAGHIEAFDSAPGAVNYFIGEETQPVAEIDSTIPASSVQQRISGNRPNLLREQPETGGQHRRNGYPGERHHRGEVAQTLNRGGTQLYALADSNPSPHGPSLCDCGLD